jgi:hypothetical protein
MEVNVERDRSFPSEAQRIENARTAIANGTRAKQERETLNDLRSGYRKMSRGFRGGNYARIR